MRLCTTLFVLFLASVPVYHQQTAGGQGETQIKNPEPNQATLAVSIHQPETKAKQDDAYDPRQDCLYRAYLAFTIIGVFVAMGAVAVFYLQTKATEDSARAAMYNARAVVNSQRPWIAVRRKEPFVSNSFVFEVICISGVPAKMIHIYADFQTVGRGESLQPIYKNEQLQYPLMLAPPDGAKKIWDIDSDILGANTPLWKDIQDGNKTLYFLGKVEYTDEISFDDAGKHVIHETRWCFEYVGGAIGRSGPLEANDYT